MFDTTEEQELWEGYEQWLDEQADLFEYEQELEG